jgi:hypothetical protein
MFIVQWKFFLLFPSFIVLLSAISINVHLIYFRWIENVVKLFHFKNLHFYIQFAGCWGQSYEAETFQVCMGSHVR